MKLSQSYLRFTFVFIFLLSCNQLKAQTDLAGKTFIGLTNESCKSKADGGCWIVTHTVFAFTSDSVSISYNIKGSCTPVDTMYDKQNAWLKTYGWKESEGIIQIENYEAYNSLYIQENYLTGQDLRYDNPNFVTFSILKED